ncbi:hypothetical protein OS493_024036 [Desmophyllum pertusum]|uniref:Uncharacterized protein n=1 Tax=Desmophyllum pertusum TaxID=174260 RepID=A0A9W9ZQ91_9CNID|nr:hypothetical protein OS493_024036 [Desmophyllum pertusum]
MPKQRKSTRGAQQAKRGNPAIRGAVPPQVPANYSSMSTEALRLLLAQRSLIQTAALPIQPAVSATGPAQSLPAAQDLSALIAQLVNEKLQNFRGAQPPQPPCLPSGQELSPVANREQMVTNPPALPQNNNNQHGGQTSTLNLGDPSNVASLHPDYRLPSLASHLSNSTIASITNGEYVDLASLLPLSSLLNKHVSDPKLQIGKEGLTIPLPSPVAKRT